MWKDIPPRCQKREGIGFEMINTKTDVKIIIATHKKYRMPDDPMYIPLHVGAEGKKDESGNEMDLGYQKDNTGPNISWLNPSFCELTGLYWAWKNIDADYIGLTHYRRHFSCKKNRDPFKAVLKYEDIREDLPQIKLFVPKKRHYYIESIYSHYKHTHYGYHLDLTKTIIQERYPEYLKAYKKVMKNSSGYMFNMFIMEHTMLDRYCTWLFNILFDLKDRIDNPKLSSYQGRFYGRISELIFNVWLEQELTEGRIRRSQIKELPWIYMERINRLKKGTAFLKAKFLSIKYEESF